ncbi:hypothetical protein HRR83_007555 [Exophiala dermatitidis]|nr:hypothetical protein HRR75_006426 [Exophiala dermatitidis]KAJ4510529.1 hypothetical protein HRR74_007001 [Exophiala dermatitidis]KAJ4510538.1 hypothetical protein HRR73_006610 [Exophiala dermatitidis]KAJ4531564.1 hypothetical protein HRR77_009414 [Exophiala dermatitidis]KAJ4535146.1 hypothetical protein HRR76_007038 [Exophiala dermatitidis]
MASSNRYLNLDWRSGPKSDVLFESLQRLCNTIDANRQVAIVSSESKAKAVVVDGNGNKVMRQTRTTCIKARKSVERHSDNEYLAKLVTIMRFLMRNAALGKTEMVRAFEYQIKSDRITPEDANKIMKDIALTIGVHPFLLGVEPESVGQVYIPEGIKLAMMETSSARVYVDKKAKYSTSLNGGKRHQIPRLLVDIAKVNQAEASIRAVVVCEHRSIVEKFPKAFEDARFRGVFLVTTGGYPDVATREFLHILARHRAFKTVPFLYISDGDPNGIEIYAVLKFGSKACAFAAPQMTCPNLKWAGLSLAQYQMFVKSWPDRFGPTLPPLSAEKTKEAMEDAQKAADAAVERVHTLKVRKPTRQSKRTVATLLGNDCFDDELEGDARAELERLEVGPKVDFFDLMQPDPHGVVEFIVEAVSAELGEIDSARPRRFYSLSEAQKAAAAAAESSESEEEESGSWSP